MKTILAFETSSPVLSVALGTGEGKVREVCSRGFFQHSEHLILLIDRLLKKEKLSLDDIDSFAIDRGPGSFTGLRIGFSLLKGFLAIQKRPCFGALSLDMIAAKAAFLPDSRLGVICDARRDAAYARFYRCRKGKWAAERKLELLSFSQLKARISEGTYLVGDAVERYRGALEEAFGKRIHFLSPGLNGPSAATLVQWFQAQDGRLSFLKGPRDFLPLYFRASEAEEKRRSTRIL